MANGLPVTGKVKEFRGKSANPRAILTYRRGSEGTGYDAEIPVTTDIPGADRITEKAVGRQVHFTIDGNHNLLEVNAVAC